MSASRHSRRAPSREDGAWRQTVTRALVAVVAEVTIYYTLPLDHGVELRTVGWLILGLVVFAVVLARQIAQIARSPYPRLRAAVAIMVSLPLFVLIWSTAYYLIGHTTNHAFNEALSRTDALYFTVTVFTTVGFGDIVPTQPVTRVLVMFQMLGDLVLIGLIGRVVVGAVSAGLQRRPTESVEHGAPVSSRPDDED